MTVNIVLGDYHPPVYSSTKGNGGSPIKELRAAYPNTKLEPVFWRPFAGLADHERIPFSAWLASIKVGWIMLYILVYIPTLMIIRMSLKVA
jgi:hypothetical protein